MNVNCILTNREGLEREVVRLGGILGPLRRSSRPEGVRKLVDREDALAAMPIAFFLRHTRQQAQIVCLNRLLPAPGLKLALRTMPVQSEVGC